MLASRFVRAAKQHKLDSRDQLDCSQFRVPTSTRKGLAESQMSLF
jgi:hypothetical protein